MLAQYGLSDTYALFGQTAKAIILNSAHKRFISEVNATNAVSKDNPLTANGPKAGDYLIGAALRVGGTGSAPTTEDWTPSARVNSGTLFSTTEPLDDEQGAGLLDVQRALTQMGGPGMSG